MHRAICVMAVLISCLSVFGRAEAQTKREFHYKDDTVTNAVSAKTLKKGTISITQIKKGKRKVVIDKHGNIKYAPLAKPKKRAVIRNFDEPIEWNKWPDSRGRGFVTKRKISRELTKLRGFILDTSAMPRTDSVDSAEAYWEPPLSEPYVATATQGARMRAGEPQARTSKPVWPAFDKRGRAQWFNEDPSPDWDYGIHDLPSTRAPDVKLPITHGQIRLPDRAIPPYYIYVFVDPSPGFKLDLVYEWLHSSMDRDDKSVVEASDIPRGSPEEQARFILRQCKLGDYHNAEALMSFCDESGRLTSSYVKPETIGTTAKRIQWYYRQQRLSEAIRIRDACERGDYENVGYLDVMIIFGKVRLTDIDIKQTDLDRWIQAAVKHRP